MRSLSSQKARAGSLPLGRITREPLNTSQVAEFSGERISPDQRTLVLEKAVLRVTPCGRDRLQHTLSPAVSNPCERHGNRPEAAFGWLLACTENGGE